MIKTHGVVQRYLLCSSVLENLSIFGWCCHQNKKIDKCFFPLKRISWKFVFTNNIVSYLIPFLSILSILFGFMSLSALFQGSLNILYSINLFFLKWINFRQPGKQEKLWKKKLQQKLLQHSPPKLLRSHRQPSTSDTHLPSKE